MVWVVLSINLLCRWKVKPIGYVNLQQKVAQYGSGLSEKADFEIANDKVCVRFNMCWKNRRD